MSAETTPYAAQIDQLAAARVVDGYAVGDHKEFRPGDLVITLGAGNVWQVGEEFLAALRGQETSGPGGA